MARPDWEVIMIIKMFHEIVKRGLHFIVQKIKDVYRYYRDKEYEKFDGFGLHVYVGLFGSGKTSSMVHRAYELACRFRNMKILTNIKLQGFPAWTKITYLEHYRQIVDSPPDTLILIDEISTIFNSRRWDKDGIPPALLSMLLQVRKERKMIYATAQRFAHVDKLVRDITFTVRECSCWFGRWNWVRVYDAYEYETRNAMKPAICQRLQSFIQTDKIRKLYDTYEFVKKMQKEEYMTEKEILEKRGESPAMVNIVTRKVKTIRR